MHADSRVFQTLVPCHRYRHHHHALLDCFDVSSTATSRNDPAERHQLSNTVVCNGRCPTLDMTEDDGQGQPRQRRRWRQGWAPRAAVLFRTVEGAFFPGSVVALLLTVAVVLCVDAAAVVLDGVVRAVVDVDRLDTLVERGIDDLSTSINAFSDFLNAELTSPLCVDRVDLDVLRLTSLLHQRRFNVAGTLHHSPYRQNCGGARKLFVPDHEDLVLWLITLCKNVGWGAVCIHFNPFIVDPVKVYTLPRWSNPLSLIFTVRLHVMQRTVCLLYTSPSPRD